MNVLKNVEMPSGDNDAIEFPMADTVDNSQLRVHHCLWGIYTHTF